MNDPIEPSVCPLHSIGHCPICGGGLCGIRICTGDDPTEQLPATGFILCDECEAIWMQPELSGDHLYADPENPNCPVCRGNLWRTSRWATREEVEHLGWTAKILSDLDAVPGA